ncbi:IGFALS [Branchiostoma lanceolatum]|uniref:IGFALS protein n=1 Tax=Branchiostoma lanceolatum TaxID=7740 RepID=A0A8K0A2D0_BRALA|nr:IGFALS [Branchiostoma lanceolatum]
MAGRLTSCLMRCVHVLAVISIVSAQFCARQCRCEGTTMDCSHGSRKSIPQATLIPALTETLLMNDNLMTKVNPRPALPNLLELNLEDNSITEVKRDNFFLRQNIQVLRIGGNEITDVASFTFDFLSHLVRLYLNRNIIKTIEAFGGVSAPSSLETLDLQKNKLTSISIGTFTGIPLLTELNLSSNNISTIEDGSFGRLQKLRVLYLHSNRILKLTNATFIGMYSLNRLFLSNNKIQNLPDMAFNGAPTLEVLDLASNGISTIRQAAFSGLIHLTALFLDRNNISFIEDSSFRELVKLHTLYLWNNTLQGISASTFIGLAPEDRTDNTGLEVLFLAVNRLTAVRRDDFSRLTALTYLTLYGNNITSEGLEDGSFHNLGNLVFLGLYGNALTNIYAGTFEGLVSLETLQLGNNPFRNLQPFTFANLPAMTTLDLSRKLISSLHPDVFANLTTVRYLNIAGIKSVSPRVFRHLSCLRALWVGNRLTCDCDTLDMATWINRTAVDVRQFASSSKPVTCYNPRQLRRVHLANLQQKDLLMTCPATTDLSSTDSTVQICPTPSPTTEVMTYSGLVTTQSSKAPLSSSLNTRQPGTCPSPENVTIRNVKESRAEIEWSHEGKAVSTDLTGYVIQYQIFGQQSWMKTQKIHSSGRYFTILDLLPDTPYQACVAVFCKDELIQPEPCASFTTLQTSKIGSQPAPAIVVGLAVGIPSMLIILGLVAAGVIFLKMRERSSAKHEAGHKPERPQRKNADQSTAEDAVGFSDDPPYRLINDNQRTGHGQGNNEYRNPRFVVEPVAGKITSSYLNLGEATVVLNLTGIRKDDGHEAPFAAPRQNPRFSNASINNPVYSPENIYTTVDDDALGDEAAANASPTEDGIYIGVLR